MKALIQRVACASVEADGQIVGQIGPGILLLLGVMREDTQQECDYLAHKAAHIRIFEDEQGRMNRSLLDLGGEMLVVSQFTLCADCKKGRRPSFAKAAPESKALPLYERFLRQAEGLGVRTACGRFGADMLVSLKNDGPVTIWLDTDEIMPEGAKG